MAADSSTSAQKRRVTKPLIEKRRRARINYSLAQLKEMVAKPSSNTQENRANRLEKADILEMTVEYVKRVHGSCNTTGPSNNASVHSESDHSFEEGYRLCMSEVQNFFISNYRKQSSKEFLNRSLQSYLKQKIQRTVGDRNFIIATTFDVPILSKKDAIPPKEHTRKNNKMAGHKNNFQMNINDSYEFHSETSNFGSNSSSVSTDDEMSERLPVVEIKLKEQKNKSLSSYDIMQQYPTQQHGSATINVPESMWRPW